jgi:hypothetical protein
MLIDGKIGAGWHGYHCLLAWDSLCCYWERTLCKLEIWLGRFIYSLGQLLARMLDLQR